jgi:3-(3-hydroxy-phenyl)propionate hydroxylase
MPVWLGQGWNSGIRDATNLAWKLASVLQGQCADALLDTYDLERRDHAKAMIDLNMTAGSIMKADRRVAVVRDVVAAVLGLVPSVKSWFTDMRFKPVPRYTAGVIVDPGQGTPGTATARIVRRLVPVVDAVSDASPVGLQFIQPRVNTADRDRALLDDVIGNWWTIAAWGNDPARLLGPAERDLVDALGARLVCLVPEAQRRWAEREHVGSPATVIGDVTGELKKWFDARPVGVVFLRPDRFVAAACLAQETTATLRAVLAAMSYIPAPSTPASRRAEGADDVHRSNLHVA